MKRKLVNKFSKNTIQRIWFYVVFIYGVVASVWLMQRVERYQQDEWYIRVMFVAHFPPTF